MPGQVGDHHRHAGLPFDSNLYRTDLGANHRTHPIAVNQQLRHRRKVRYNVDPRSLVAKAEERLGLVQLAFVPYRCPPPACIRNGLIVGVLVRVPAQA
jgi:hypothetical protein